MRGTQGSLKKLPESLNKCEKSGKKAKYAVFCVSENLNLLNIWYDYDSFYFGKEIEIPKQLSNFL